METDYLDMMTAAIDQNPTDFSDSFNNIFMSKVADAINNKRIDFAKNLYNSKPVEDIDLDLETEE